MKLAYGSGFFPEFFEAGGDGLVGLFLGGGLGALAVNAGQEDEDLEQFAFFPAHFGDGGILFLFAHGLNLANPGGEDT